MQPSGYVDDEPILLMKLWYNFGKVTGNGIRSREWRDEMERQDFRSKWIENSAEQTIGIWTDQAATQMSAAEAEKEKRAVEQDAHRSPGVAGSKRLRPGSISRSLR
jgi:hypothetical protein